MTPPGAWAPWAALPFEEAGQEINGCLMAAGETCFALMDGGKDGGKDGRSVTLVFFFKKNHFILFFNVSRLPSLGAVTVN